MEINLKKENDERPTNTYAGRGNTKRKCPFCKKTEDQIWVRASATVLTWCPCGQVFVIDLKGEDPAIPIYVF